MLYINIIHLNMLYINIIHLNMLYLYYILNNLYIGRLIYVGLYQFKYEIL